MRLEYYSLNDLKRQIKTIASEYLDMDKYKLFFFGSRVTGKGTDRSDIDIGIKGPRPVDAKILFAMEEQVENLPTLYKIELVDFTVVADKFSRIALEQIEPIN